MWTRYLLLFIWDTNLLQRLLLSICQFAVSGSKRTYKNSQKNHFLLETIQQFRTGQTKKKFEYSKIAFMDPHWNLKNIELWGEVCFFLFLHYSLTKSCCTTTQTYNFARVTLYIKQSLAATYNDMQNPQVFEIIRKVSLRARTNLRSFQLLFQLCAAMFYNVIQI